MTATAREALAHNLCARICDPRRSYDEIRVLDRLFSRIERGADSYGPLDLSKARDWDRELAEEYEDVLVYKAIAKVLACDERTHCEAADEQVAGFLGVDAGLRELRDSQPVIQPLLSFDMSDENGGES